MLFAVSFAPTLPIGVHIPVIIYLRRWKTITTLKTDIDIKRGPYY